MSKIRVFRKKELLNLKREISFFVNDTEYLIGSNDSIDINLEPGSYSIQTKIDWIKSDLKQLIVKGNKSYSIQLKPFISNNIYYIFSSFLPLVNFFMYKVNSLLFWAINVVILVNLLYFIYYFTIGKKKYITLHVEEG
jgi:hypothetical protein